LTNSSSKDEERSTTRIFSEGPPFSKTGERWRREETCYGDPGGGRDPNGAGNGVKALHGDEESPLKGEQEHLVPLLCFIVVKRRREENHKQKVKECEIAINAR
jgi:hypothetical protein